MLGGGGLLLGGYGLDGVEGVSALDRAGALVGSEITVSKMISLSSVGMAVNITSSRHTTAAGIFKLLLIKLMEKKSIIIMMIIKMI